MVYRVIERERKGEEFKELGMWDRQDTPWNAINWADGYAFAYASYKHRLNKPCWQQVDGYQWFNNKTGYSLRVVEGYDSIEPIKTK